MLFNRKNKVLSFCLVAAILIGSFASAATVNSLADSAFTTDNFSNPDVTKQYFEEIHPVNISNIAEYAIDKSRYYDSGFSIANGKFYPSKSANNNRRQIIADVIKTQYIDSAPIHSIETSLYISDAATDMEKNAGIYAYLCAAEEGQYWKSGRVWFLFKDGILKIYFQKTVEYGNGKSTQIAQISDYTADKKVTISVAYDYATDALTNLNFTVKIDGTEIKSYINSTVTSNEALAKSFTVGFGSSMYSAATSFHNAIGFDDFSVEYKDTAESFYAAYKNVLEKDLSVISGSDYDTLVEAYGKYNNLSSADKNSLLSLYGIAGKQILSRLNFSKSGSEYFSADDFTNAGFTAANFEEKSPVNVSNIAAMASAYKVSDYSVDEANGLFIPALSNSGNARRQIIATVLKSDVLSPTRPVTSYTTSLYINENATNKEYNSGIYAYLCGPEESGEYWKSGRIWMNINSSNGSLEIWFQKTVAHLNGSTTKIAVLPNFDTSKELTVTVNYDYSNPLQTALSFYVYAGGKEISSYENRTVSSDEALSCKFTVGIGSATTKDLVPDSIKYTGVSVQHYSSYEEKADEFARNYSDILSLTTGEILKDNEARLTAALKSYIGLDDEVKSVLISRGVYLHLTELSAVLFSDINSFRSEYAVLLSKDISHINKDNLEEINTALAEYKTLPDYIRAALLTEYDFLLSAKEKAETREDDDFGDFSEDFENGLENWKIDYSNKDGYAFETITDPLDDTNSVLHLKGNALIAAVKDKYWPKVGTMTKFSFRMYQPSYTSFNPGTAFYSYKDYENYFSYSLSDFMRTAQRDDGTLSSSSRINSVTLNRDSWLNVTVVYNSITSKATIVVSDADENSYSMTFRYYISGRLAFGFDDNMGMTDRHLSKDLYIDDVNVEFSQGDWDIDDTVTNPTVYYSGNTFISPDETATITGEQLSTTVKEAYIMQLDDASVSTAAYVKQTTFETNGANCITSPVLPTWNDSTAVKLDIVHMSGTSMEFVIPKQLTKGVYAVKLIPVEQNAEPAYVYINTPRIQLAIGDEGEIVTPGGTLRITGSNMVPTGNAQDVTVVLKKDGTETILPVANIYDDDNYSLEVKIPDSLETGTYEIFVHNGYGDETAFSTPVTIAVGDSPRDSWSKTVYNVKSYGAVGDGTANDMAAIVTALEDIDRAGGGVLYFPCGTYRVSSTIILTENVTVQGESLSNTAIFWSANDWEYGEAPETLIAVTSNVQFRDIQFEGVRVRNLITSYDNEAYRNTFDFNQNIYFENVRTQFYYRSGAITGGGTGGRPTGELTGPEIQTLLQAEMSGYNFIQLTCKNLQMKNLTIDSDRQTSPGACRSAYIYASYFQMQNCKFMRGTFHGATLNTLIEDSEFGPDCPIFQGMSHSYFARNYCFDNTMNNREGLLNDGSPYRTDMILKYVDDTHYLITNYTYADSYLRDYTLYIGSGQGAGQVRQIKDNYYTVVDGKKYVMIELYEPFTVRINRNSVVYLHEARQSRVVVGNIFENQSCVGTYGTFVDNVLDGNVYQKGHRGISINAHLSYVWYLSIVKETVDSDLYLHGEGYGYDGTGALTPKTSSIGFSQFTASKNCGVAILVKNCVLKNGSYIKLDGGSSSSMIAFVFENNTVEKAKYGIVTSQKYATFFDGLILRNNDLKGCDNYYDSVYLGTDLSDVINKQGYQQVLIINENIPENPRLGDVNGDGKISLKDCTLVKYYVLGDVVLTDEQQQRADMNADGNITLKDATLIRELLIS